MKHLVEQAEEALFNAEDSVCLERARLVTEAWAQHEHEPADMRRARCLEAVLSRMTLHLAWNPLMAGNTSSALRAWMLIPEHGLNIPEQVLYEHDDLQGFLAKHLPADQQEDSSTRRFGGNVGGSAGIGHLAIDLPRVVDEGLLAIRDCIKGSSAGDRDYREAQCIALDAVIAWAARYADAAERCAAEATDLARATAHRRVAAACRQVPARPARSFFEALQAIVLVHLATAIEGHGMSISIGLPDRAMARFSAEVARDFAAAVLDVRAFLLTVASNSYLGRASKTQAVTVGGCDARGCDASNAVTLAFLEAFDQTPVSDPHLFVRWHGGLDERVRVKAAAMLSRGRSMPLLVHDEPTIRGFVQHGYAPADAADYCVIGCNELGIPGRAWASAAGTAGGLNYLKLLESTLNDDALQADASLETLWETFAARMRTAIQGGAAARVAAVRAAADRVPTPFTSAMMRGSEERGVDLLTAMPYQQAGFFERGLSNAANAWAMIERVVFEQQTADLATLRAAVASNWADAGCAAIREAIEHVPHWGNDEDAADRWTVRMLELRSELLDETAQHLGLPAILACHVVRSLHHTDGRGIGATPDGRLAGQPVADSIGGVTGTMAAGPTAMLNSVLKIDAAKHYPGGYNLNLTLPPGAADSAVITALIDGFFGGGGQELQINVLDAQRLRAARLDPASHRDLVVRVAGLSARFIELSATEQEELIRRAEAADVGAMV